MNRNNELDQILLDVVAEFERATDKHGSLNSAHEAYAVILEEIEEVWEEVKKRSAKRNPYRLRAELVQVAAMAIRAVYDVADPLIAEANANRYLRTTGAQDDNLPGDTQPA